MSTFREQQDTPKFVGTVIDSPKSKPGTTWAEFELALIAAGWAADDAKQERERQEHAD